MGPDERIFIFLQDESRKKSNSSLDCYDAVIATILIRNETFFLCFCPPLRTWKWILVCFDTFSLPSWWFCVAHHISSDYFRALGASYSINFSVNFEMIQILLAYNIGMKRSFWIFFFFWKSWNGGWKNMVKRPGKNFSFSGLYLPVLE